MDHPAIIDAAVVYVQDQLADAEKAHDWWHIYRVWQLAQHIASFEEADMLIVELGALLHDIADYKFHDGDEKIGPEIAAQFLASVGLPEKAITHIQSIIQNISFRGLHYEQQFFSPELAIIQDADRLDAMGAIGIARAFTTGAYFDELLHDPGQSPQIDQSAATYVSSKGQPGKTVINHFYEKLLLLKERMNTATGKQLAVHRHAYMQDFLEEFFAEREGKR